MYIGITGLNVRHLWQRPFFLFYGMRAFKQAERSRGNLLCEVKRIGSVQHTLTAWEDHDALMAYVYSDAHAQAIAAMKWFSGGRTLSYESDRIPSWAEALAILRERGIDYAE